MPPSFLPQGYQSWKSAPIYSEHLDPHFIFNQKPLSADEDYTIVKKVSSYDEDGSLQSALGPYSASLRNPFSLSGASTPPTNVKALIEIDPRMSPCSSIEPSPFDTPPSFTPRRLSAEAEGLPQAPYFDSEGDADFAHVIGSISHSTTAIEMCDV
jgi:hypothetical protein